MGCTSSSSSSSFSSRGRGKDRISHPVSISFSSLSSPSSSLSLSLPSHSSPPRITYDDGESQILSVPSPQILQRNDYGDFTFVQSGGAGKVFLSPRLSDGKIFAMKFFGYTSKQPKLPEIQREISLMQALLGIPNIVQIEGIFMDSSDGYVPNRIYDTPFPIIVMEALLGGDLFERIEMPNDVVTEKFLSKAFRGVIEALHQIHLRGFIHRDLKLENLIYSTKERDSSIKVVDFGMMMKIIPPNGIFMSLNVEGTAGYCAPESYLKRQYSAQSDVWQAGCCLYSMLSGYAAFSQDNIDKIITAQYVPMVGIAWDTISEPAKDLLRHILVKDPHVRYTTTQILAHPWLQGTAPEVELDSGYRKRVSKLALRVKMKMLFLDEGLQTLSKTRRHILVETLPFLQNTNKKPEEYKSSSSSNQSLDTQLKNSLNRDGVNLESKDQHLHQKLKFLKSGLLYAVSPFGTSSSSLDLSGKIKARRTASYTPPGNQRNLESGNEVSPDSMGISRRISDTSLYYSHRHGNTSTWRGINLSQISFEDFVVILDKVDLPQLATKHVFDIFDLQTTGLIDMKEFLLTILTLHPHNMKGDIDAVHLFFNFFDVKGSGYIDLEDLKLVVGCLLADEIRNQTPTQEPITVKNVEELFHTIDQEGRGKINFAQFQVFFDTVLRSTTMLASYTASSQSQDQISKHSPL